MLAGLPLDQGLELGREDGPVRLGGRHGAPLAVLDPLDEVGGELFEVVDAGDVLAVLGVVLQPVEGSCDKFGWFGIRLI